ncbi:13603_t:CDS:2, partial [Dentiscutata erythropus]
KLKYMTKNVDVFDSFPTSQLSNLPTLTNKTVISSIVRRIVWYPVIPLITQFFSSFVETYAYFNHVTSYPLFLVCFVGISLQGLLNTLVFSQDIAVIRAFQAIKLQWWISNVNSYESHYPYNKAIKDEFSMPEKLNDFVELKALNYNSGVNNNNLGLQPSFFECFFQLISPKLLSPNNSFAGNKPDTSFAGNKPDTSFALFGKDNLKKDITINNQNDDQDNHLVLLEPVHLKDSFQYPTFDLSSHYLNPSISLDLLIDSSRNNQTNQTNTNNTNLIDRSNCTVNDDEGRIDVILVNGESTKRVSEEFTKIFNSDIDISQEIEMFDQILKIL